MGIDISPKALALAQGMKAARPRARGPVEPGEEVVLKGRLRWPGQESFLLRLDMVAELVAWFSERGSTDRVTIASHQL